MKKSYLGLFLIVLILGGIVWMVTKKVANEPNANNQGLTHSEALSLAKSGECLEKGTVNESGIYNPTSRTWWFDLVTKPEFTRSNCNPACVINELEKTQEINWRCSGLIPPNNNPPEENIFIVTSPTPNSNVSSPLRVEGRARGPWYFEATFPIKIIDENGRELGVGYATAQDEWMTEDFVPFVGTINFTTPTTTQGTLIFEKSNPSGLPENDDERRLPIQFTPTTTSQRQVQLFYYNELKDKDQQSNIQCSRAGLQGVQRSIPRTITPIQDTIRLLLQGNLTTTERTQGLSTEFPLAGFELRSASLNNSILTLNFNDLNNRTSGGSCRAGILWYQIEATAKQFPEVRQVKFLPEDLFQP